MSTPAADLGTITYTADDWTEIGASVVPEQHRAAFLDVIEGRSDWGEARWVEPNGTHPMSPGLTLQTIVTEFEFVGRRRPIAVSYNLAYEHHDTTLEPGDRWGDFTSTATVIGLRTSPDRGSQEVWFVDAGANVCAVLIRKYSATPTPKD